MSDGQLKFDTKVDTSGIKKGTNEIKREFSGLNGVASKVKETLKKALKLNKKDAQIDISYAAQHPQSFFKDNIEDELYSIKDINKELVEAKAKLDQLTGLKRFGNVPGLEERIQKATSAVKNYETALAQAQQRLSDNQQWLQERIEIDATSAKVDELQAKMDKLNATGVSQTSSTYKKLAYDLNSAKAKLDVLTHNVDTSGVKLEGFSNVFKRIGSVASTTSKKISDKFGKEVPKAVNKTSSSLKYFSRMIMSMLVMSSLFGLMRTFTDGMKQMSKVCPDVNEALSSIMSNLRYLKNSFLAAFSPLVSIVVPVVNTICNALARLMNMISMLISYLSGKSTYKVAIKQQKDFAASLDKTGSSAKNANKALASFDEINQLNLSNSSGGGASNGDIDGNTFVDKEMPNKQSAMVETIKKIWDGLALTFDNLANSFMKAWNANNNGLRIMTALKNIVMILLNGLLQCVNATAKWAETLDFSPMLESIASLLEALTPVVQKLTDAFVWFYVNLLLPIGKWFVESSIPAAINVISASLNVFNSILTALQPLGTWLWEHFLKPIAEWTGDAIVWALEAIAIGLNNVANWISQNEQLVQILAIAIGTIGTVLFALSSPINTVMMAITALIAVVALLSKHWDLVKETAKKCWDSIVATFSAVGEWFNTNVITPLTNLFKGFVNGILGFFESMANGIIGIFEDIVNFFVKAINSIGFDLPGILGGGHIGFDLSPITLGRVSLPRLATGTVVPPNAGQFAAILGDNKRETEVVSPLSTMKQAMIEALSEFGYGDINLRVDGSLAALVRLLKIELDKEEKRRGRKLVTT